MVHQLYPCHSIVKVIWRGSFLTQTSIYHDVLNLVEFEYKITLSNPFLSNEGKLSCSRKTTGFFDGIQTHHWSISSQTTLKYVHAYFNTARLFPCFPLGSTAVYTVYIHGLFFYVWALLVFSITASFLVAK